MLDLRNQTFGRLTAIEPTEERFRKDHVVWRCVCECGKEVRVPGYYLKHGRVQSCGCLRDDKLRRDITGQKRGHLTAICPTEERENNQTVWKWQCTCGAYIYKTLSVVGKKHITMCPECSHKLKKQQGEQIASQLVRDENGRVPRQVEQIIAGEVTRHNTSGVRGVCWHSARRKWYARIQDVNGRVISLGYYSTIEEAAAARRRAVEEIYGPAPDKPSDEN